MFLIGNNHTTYNLLNLLSATVVQWLQESPYIFTDFMSVPPSKISKNEETIVRKNWKNKKTRLQKSFNPISCRNITKVYSFLCQCYAWKWMYFRLHNYWQLLQNWPKVGPILKSKVFVPKIVHEIIDIINHDVIERLTLF